MAREAPLVQAALRIRTAAQAAEPGGFAGVAVRNDTVVVYWKGAVPPSVRKLVTGESAKVPVVVQPAAHSAEELKRAADEVRNKVRAVGDRSILSIGYPVTGAGLTVTVAGASVDPPALQDAKVRVTLVRADGKAAAAPKAATGSRTNREPTSRPAAPVKATARVATVTTGAVVGGWPVPSRMADATPGWGGAHIINWSATGGNHGWQTRVQETGEVVYADDLYHCTSGIPALLNGIEYLVGALSCGEGRDTFVTPGNYAVNTPITTSIARASGVDLTLPKAGVEPYLYDGQVFSQSGWQINGWQAPVAGQSVCVAGAETGTFCDATIDDMVGTETAFIPNSHGTSDETRNMTVLGTHYNDGPVWPGRRPYQLGDGSLCNAFEFMQDVDEAGCLQFPLGPGDIGAAVYTLPGAGADTGVTVTGLLVHQRDGDGQSPYSYHIVGVDQIVATYGAANIAALTTRNDRH